MLGAHDPNKYKMVGLWMERNFLAEVDSARGETGRSQFLRDALAEKLKREGVMILREKVIAPDRAGKARPISYFKNRAQKLKDPKGTPPTPRPATRPSAAKPINVPRAASRCGAGRADVTPRNSSLD